MPNIQAQSSSNTATSTVGPSAGRGVTTSLSGGRDGDASVEARTSSLEARIMGPTVAFDTSYAPEMLEFWARKYQDVKAELNGLKVSVSCPSLAQTISPRSLSTFIYS